METVKDEQLQQTLAALHVKEGDSLQGLMRRRDEKKILELCKHIGRSVFRYVVASRRGAVVGRAVMWYSVYVEYRAADVHTLGCLADLTQERQKACTVCRTLAAHLATPLSMEEFYL